MTTPFPLSISIPLTTSQINPIHRSICYLLTKLPQPIKLSSLKCTKFGRVHQNWTNLKVLAFRDKEILLRLGESKNGVLWGEKKLIREKRVVMVRFNKGFGFNGGDGGGGGGGRNLDSRVLGNLALAVGLTYISMTGQLGWVLDTIVSLWLLAVIVPVVGLGVFLWWAGRDMIQGTCPNCGNAFQVFKSTLNDDFQLCPFCSQPFSVEENEFVKEPIKFSNKRSSPFGQFDDFAPWSRKGKDTSTAVVDVEAEIKDAE